MSRVLIADTDETVEFPPSPGGGLGVTITQGLPLIVDTLFIQKGSARAMDGIKKAAVNKKKVLVARRIFFISRYWLASVI